MAKKRTRAKKPSRAPVFVGVLIAAAAVLLWAALLRPPSLDGTYTVDMGSHVRRYSLSGGTVTRLDTGGDAEGTYAVLSADRVRWGGAELGLEVGPQGFVLIDSAGQRMRWVREGP